MTEMDTNKSILNREFIKKILIALQLSMVRRKKKYINYKNSISPLYASKQMSVWMIN